MMNGIYNAERIGDFYRISGLNYDASRFKVMEVPHTDIAMARKELDNHNDNSEVDSQGNTASTG